jgi:AcrR family transcriptional regulator
MLRKETVLSIQTRRARHRQSLRQQVLDAARDIFVKEGYQGLSMRRIANKIDYSPTAIYLHFKDKQELVFHLCEETFSRLVRELESLPDEKDPVVRVKAGLRRYVDFGLKNPQHYLATFVIPHENRFDPQIAPQHYKEDNFGMRALGILRTQIAACIAARRFRKLDLELATRTLWSATHGITSLLIVFPQFPWGDRDALIGQVIDATIDGLRPRG